MSSQDIYLGPEYRPISFAPARAFNFILQLWLHIPQDMHCRVQMSMSIFDEARIGVSGTIPHPFHVRLDVVSTVTLYSLASVLMMVVVLRTRRVGIPKSIQAVSRSFCLEHL